ncbi:hypothetical protein [Bythopirellula polymerisocia]|uniref:AsmA-like C-terminal domain-containing protein n=1 Tax=Bythopirellula polymerisocia TaxID=2528003 RepID=A0A5C6D3Q7_9BACT|nr:hypothetical protein [Bythopirellula polymerisocia]TWU30411.1 hypothetical protein Pla144_11970 [Bythopirellula polymerisocia]
MARRRKTEERQPRRKNRFKQRLIVFLLLVVGTVGALPTIISHSPLRDTLLNWQMPPGGWCVQSEQGAFSWTGAQSLSNVAIIAPDGNPLLTAESLTIERSLAALALQSRILGTTRVVRPVAFVTTRSDGSNVEDFLSAVRKRKESLPGETVDSTKSIAAKITLQAEIEDGRVQGYDAVSETKWQVEEANLSAALSAERGLTAAEGSANVRYADDRTGRVKFRVQDADDNQQQLDLLAEGLLLSPLKPFLTRTVGECQLAGTAALDAHALWNPKSEGPLSLTTWGRAECDGLAFSGEVLQGDRLECNRLEIPWKGSFAHGELGINELKLKCDWADVAAQGSLALEELKALSLTNLPHREMKFSGKVSLARLAQMLPHAMQVREGVRIDAGEVEFNANSGLREGAFSWSTEVSLANLAGQDSSRPIRWEDPVQIAAQWKDSPAGPRLDRFTLTAPSTAATVVSTDDRMHGDFQIDLEQLVEKLGQFVDLQGLECRGYARGNFQYTTTSDTQFEALADVKLSELVVTRGERLLWEEPQLVVDLRAAGRAEHMLPKSLSTSSMSLHGDRDELAVTLLEAVDLKSVANWQVKIEGNGPVDSWAGRLRPWMQGIPDEISGQAKLQAKLTVAEKEMALSEMVGSIEGLHIRKGEMAVDDPQVNFSGDCLWNAEAHRLHSREFQLAGSIVAFRSRDVRVDLEESQSTSQKPLPVVTGEIAYRTDLERLASAAGLVGGREATWPRGTAAGVLRLATNSEQILADFSLDGEAIALVKSASSRSTTKQQPIIVWSEPKLRTTGKAVYNIAREQIALEKFSIDGQTVQVTGKATWDKPTEGGEIVVQGSTQYDPASLDQLIVNYAGPAVRVQGDRVVRFEARGRLPSQSESDHWSQLWQATAEGGWSSASVFGLPIGTGKLQGSLGAGQLVIAPFDLAMGEGRFMASPRVVLDPTPQQMFLPAGPMFTNVQISPAVSEQMLKYVAPILAGATRVDGKFSVDLAETKIPLDDPKLTHTAGKLAVHELTVLPGPMVADLTTTIQQLQALKKGKDLLQGGIAPKPARLLSMHDQQIEFQVVEGRVYHRNLVFTIDDVPVRSQGSVGFDQSLALVIDIPIQDRWIDGEDALKGLAGQSLQVPIYGTFEKPRVDQQAMANLTKQLLRDTARQAIGGEINRQLEKLFKQR